MQRKLIGEGTKRRPVRLTGSRRTLHPVLRHRGEGVRRGHLRCSERRIQAQGMCQSLHRRPAWSFVTILDSRNCGVRNPGQVGESSRGDSQELASFLNYDPKVFNHVIKNANKKSGLKPGSKVVV